MPGVSGMNSRSRQGIKCILKNDIMFVLITFAVLMILSPLLSLGYYFLRSFAWCPCEFLAGFPVSTHLPRSARMRQFVCLVSCNGLPSHYALNPHAHYSWNRLWTNSDPEVEELSFINMQIILEDTVCIASELMFCLLCFLLAQDFNSHCMDGICFSL